jgi:hypothetical protein
MSRPTHYSPALNRFLVCVLYHEARRQKKPMTVLVNGLLESSLRDTDSWRQAREAMQLSETPSPALPAR